MLKLAAALLSLALCGLAGAASAVTITFDELQHGEIVGNQFAGMSVSIIAGNVGGGPSFAVAFDSDLPFGSPLHGDNDLLFRDRNGNEGWSRGNIEGVPLGNLLIIQENDIGCFDGICDLPDDEGSRPAGLLRFDFEISVLDFGFDLVDVESTSMEGGSISFYDLNPDTGGFKLVNIPMTDFLDGVAGIELGDRSANRIAPFTLADIQAMRADFEEIDRVEINLGGSGAVDNVNFTPVPEPTTAVLLGLGLAGLASSGRRRQR